MARYLLVPFWVFGILIFSSCNVFEFLDSPSDDSQILSKARGCFDEGDIDCAREYYEQLGDSSDAANSELAVAILYELGIDMGVFLVAFGDGGSGRSLTVLANRLLDGSVDATSRATVYSAYQRVEAIENSNLRGLTRFITAATFTAHVLAENDSTGIFSQLDITQDPETCLANLCPDPSCNIGNDLSDGSSTGDLATGDVTGIPDLALVRSGISELFRGLDEIGAGGSFANGALSFADALRSLPTAGAAAACAFRLELLNEDVGKDINE